tara:strand:+ start:73 stop:381 length:309 start_codon:yes stop_codon:yes gene_type:complete
VSFNLRNKTVDRRHLSASDKESYRPAARQRALARINQGRGALAWGLNSQKNTTSQNPGTGGFTQGITIQQQRLRDQGADLARSKQLRQEGISTPSLTQGMFN